MKGREQRVQDCGSEHICDKPDPVSSMHCFVKYNLPSDILVYQKTVL